jgi:hypothetical protein
MSGGIGSEQEQKSTPRCGCCQSDIRGSGVPPGLLSTMFHREQALPAPVVQLSLLCGAVLRVNIPPSLVVVLC